MRPDNGPVTEPFNLTPLLSRLKIQRKDTKIVRLDPNWAQKEFLQTVADQMATTGRVRIITLKARQLGISTISQALLFQLSFLTQEYTGLVVAHEVPASQNLLKMTHRYWEHYELKSLYTPKHLSKNDIGWVETKSNIKISTAGNKAAGRSATIHYLHASEVAFWPEPKTTFLGLRQTVPSEPGTVIVVESTANGVGNFFHTMWEEAVSGDSEFTPMFFPWWRHYEYRASHINLPIKPLTNLDAEERTLRKLGLDDDQLTWRRWAIKNLAQSDVRLFDQEYPSCVIGSTRVGTDEGIVPIVDIAAGSTTAFGEVVTVHQYAPTPTFTATTELGYRVTGTDDHPIFDESGLLIPLAATEGRTVRLAAPRTASTPYTVQWSELGVNHSIPVTADLAEFLGLFVGDGSYSGSTLSIVCDGRDTDVIVRVEELFRNLFGLTPRKRDVGSKNGGVEIHASSVGMKIVLDKLGVLRRRESDGGITRNVCVPEAIWRSPGPIIQRFLAGLFEADGFNSPKVARVTLFSKYEQFLVDVQLLLLSQGITSRRVATEKLSGPDANGVKHTYTGSELNLRASESRAFNRTIGFLSERKTHNIPVARGGRPAAPIRLVDKVVSVTPAAIEPVYDLTVDTGEAFDANGIHTHNTPEHAFLSSGTNIFPAEQLKAVYEPTQGYRGYLMRDGLDMTFQPADTGNLTIYKAPSRDRDYGQYLVAGDPTHSTRGDYAVAQVINRRNMEQVAVWRGRVDPASFGEELFKLGMYYNEALVVSEIEGPGYATIGKLLGMNYPRVYRRARPDNTPGKVSGDLHGWSTTLQSKHLAIGWLLKAVVDGSITLHHPGTYTEMKNYVSLDGGGYGNSGGSDHDDTVMSMAIAVTCHVLDGPLLAYGQGSTGDDDDYDWGEVNEYLRQD